jgi:hypothetical protein
MSIEDLRLRVVDLAGQLSLLAWDSKQHEPDERSQPRDTEGRHGLEAALAAMRPAPIAATLDDSALPGIKQYYNIVFSLIHSQLFVNGSDDNTLSGVEALRPAPIAATLDDSALPGIKQRRSKHVREQLSR